jgi:hypothetical protein
VFWVILAVVGIPLWLCAVGILTLIVRDRNLRKRPGNVPVNIRWSEGQRWSPGHGVWIHDVFAFRGLPAAWKEDLVWAEEASARPASSEERKRLHGIGDQAIVVTLMLREGETIDLAARPEHKRELLGPFAPASGPSAALSG